MIILIINIVLALVMLWITMIRKIILSNRLIFMAVFCCQLLFVTQLALSAGITQYRLVATLFMAVLLLCMLLNLVIYLNIKRAKHHHSSLQEKKHADLTIEDKPEAVTQQRQNIDEVVQGMHRQIHELREKISGDDQSTDELVERYIHMQKQQLTGAYCQHSIIDAVLRHKYALAERLGIELQAAVELSEEVPISSLDLCSLFVNILDNAIEACEIMINKVDQLHPYIHLACYESSGYLVVYCRNSKNNDIIQRRDGTLKSSKSMVNREHGLGISIIRDIAARYDGTNKIEYGPHYFVHSVYLSLNCNKGSICK